MLHVITVSAIEHSMTLIINRINLGVVNSYSSYILCYKLRLLQIVIDLRVGMLHIIAVRDADQLGL